ncbi:hypothetical protein [Streptomyces sp. NBC_00038]|uniref:hypothetical protein n=1 Tax=Streptomyces sp. NBC_00038 TaxID=2903615 RepID=UPI0022572D74|nr:hypothetical protein [Streptomyces sp. NBC_00038]MCX5560209.1 hypothetical protein [Streptomyces sp. NBC_00038]
MAESDDSIDLAWEKPDPLGYGQGVKEVHFIAAPLLAAAALSLSGVVASADRGTFRWPGFTLLLLVVTAMLLIATIQLGYYARKFLYSRQDVYDWIPQPPPEEGTAVEKYLRKWQNDDYQKWLRYNNRANRCFDLGLVLIGLSVAAVLAPPHGHPSDWRTAAAWTVIACTVIEISAIVGMELAVDQRSKEREETFPPTTPPPPAKETASESARSNTARAPRPPRALPPRRLPGGFRHRALRRVAQKKLARGSEGRPTGDRRIP